MATTKKLTIAQKAKLYDQQKEIIEKYLERQDKIFDDYNSKKRAHELKNPENEVLEVEKSEFNEVEKLNLDKDKLQDEVIHYSKEIKRLSDYFKELSQLQKEITTFDNNIEMGFKAATLLGITLILVSLSSISYCVKNN
jgi:hypothetical protein